MRGTGRSPAADGSSLLDDVQPRKRVQAVRSGSFVPKMGRHLKDPWKPRRTHYGMLMCVGLLGGSRGQNWETMSCACAGTDGKPAKVP